MVSKCLLGKSIPSSRAGTHIHLIKTDLQVKISLGSECRSFPVDVAEHKVLPRRAWCNKMLPYRNKDQLIPRSFPPPCSPCGAQCGSSQGWWGTACWELLIPPNSTSQGNPGLCTPSSQRWKQFSHTPNCHWMRRKWEFPLGPSCKLPIKLTDGTELSLIWAHSELASLLFGK